MEAKVHCRLWLELNGAYCQVEQALQPLGAFKSVEQEVEIALETVAAMQTSSPRTTVSQRRIADRFI